MGRRLVRNSSSAQGRAPEDVRTFVWRKTDALGAASSRSFI